MRDLIPQNDTFDNVPPSFVSECWILAFTRLPSRICKDKLFASHDPFTMAQRLIRKVPIVLWIRSFLPDEIRSCFSKSAKGRRHRRRRVVCRAHFTAEHLRLRRFRRTVRSMFSVQDLQVSPSYGNPTPDPAQQLLWRRRRRVRAM